MMVYGFMVWYTGNNAYNMVTHQGPYILSMGRAIDYKQDDAATTKVYGNETTKIHYEVIDNKFNRFEYEEAKKYVSLTYNQITKKMDANGEVQSETVPFKIGPCTKKYFTAQENRILDLMYDVEKMLCPDFFDEKIYIQGTKESNAYGLNTTYHIIEAKRCDKTENDYCETEDNIDDWLSDKVLSLRYIQ